MSDLVEIEFPSDRSTLRSLLLINFISSKAEFSCMSISGSSSFGLYTKLELYLN